MHKVEKLMGSKILENHESYTVAIFRWRWKSSYAFKDQRVAGTRANSC